MRYIIGLILIASALFQTTVAPKTTIAPKTTVIKGSAGGGTTPTVHSTCTGHVATGDVTCVFSPNILASSILYVVWSSAGPPTSQTISGCGATWTVDTIVQDDEQATGVGASAGACTITIHVVSGTDSQKDIAAAEIAGTSGIDVRGVIADQGFIGGGSTINCPALTTTVDKDLVVCGIVDYNGNGTTFTAGFGTIAIQTSQAVNVNVAIETGQKTPAGAITPTYTYSASSSFASGSVAFKP